jgi:hypothetical protein
VRVPLYLALAVIVWAYVLKQLAEWMLPDVHVHAEPCEHCEAQQRATWAEEYQARIKRGAA